MEQNLKKIGLRRAGLLVAVFWLVLLGAFIAHQAALVDSVKAHEAQVSARSLTESRQIVNARMSFLQADLALINANHWLQDYLDSPSESRRALVEQFFADVSRSRQGRYSQIRYIDETGQEVVRVDWRAGQAMTIPQPQRQNKADRPYAREGLQLAAGAQLLTALDLNVENGVVVEPFEPTLRAVSRSSNRLGATKGIVVINLAAKDLIDRVTGQGPAQFLNTWLINNQGHWISGPDPANEWGNVFANRSSQSFKHQYPGLWAQITKTPLGQISAIEQAGFWGMTLAADAHSSVDKPTASPLWHMVQTPAGWDTIGAWEDEARTKLLPIYLLLGLIGSAIIVWLSHISAKVRVQTNETARLQEQNRVMLAAAPMGILLTDKSGQIHQTNATTAQLLGWSETELRAMNIEQIFPSRKLKRHWCSQHPQLDLAHQSDVLNSVEDTFLTAQHKDGQHLAVEVILSPVQLADGPGVLAGISDISARLRANREKDRIAQQLELSASAAGLGSFVEDLDSGTVLVDARALQLWGLNDQNPSTPLAQDVLYSRMVSDDIDLSNRYLHKAARLNVRVHAGDGVVRYLRIDRIEVQNQEGRPVRIAAVTDHTAEREQAQKLADLQSEARLILEAVPVGVARSEGWKWTWVNPSFAAWVGQSAKGLQRQSIDAVLADPQEKQRLRANFQDAVRIGHNVFSAEFHVQGSSGKRLLHAKGVILDAQSESVLFAISDVTDERAQQKSLAAAMIKASQGEKAKADFVSMITHEIRTPLNGLMGGLQLLGGKDLNQRQREYLDLSLESSKLLMAVVNDLLDFHKLEAGKLELSPVPIRLSYVLTRFEPTLKTLPRHSDVEWQCVIDPALDQLVSADDLRLRQIISNLVSNALKFTTHGVVKLSAQLNAEDEEKITVQIEVADTGLGMSPETLEKLFTPFQQAHAGHARTYGGTGLGLSICKALVSEMGGTLNVRSEIGLGSTFTLKLTLPRAQEQDHQLGTRPSDGTDLSRDFTNAGQSRGPLAGRRVLLVDDNRINRSVGKAMLKELGCFVELAEDGAQAVAKLRDQALQVDLVLMDLQMPLLDGFESTALIRQSNNPALRAIPIIALTGNAAQGDVDAVIRAGMNGHLTKPINMNTLEEKIQEILGETA